MEPEYGQYLKIPLILFELKITAVERYVLALMVSYGGTLYASNSRMAEMFNVSRRAIIDAVNRLEKREYVRRRQEKNRRFLTLTAGEVISLLRRGGGEETSLLSSAKSSPLRGQGGASTSPQVVQKLHPSGAEISPYIKEYQRDTKNRGFSGERKKARLFPIPGKVCSKPGCKLPAVYIDTTGSYDHPYCKVHMPKQVREHYE